MLERIRTWAKRVRYLVLWLAGIPVGLILDYAHQALFGFSGSYDGPLYFDPILLPQSVFSRWAALWTLFVLVLWIRQHVRSSTAIISTGRTVDYLLLWTVGVVALLNWGPSLLESAIPLGIGPAGQVDGPGFTPLYSPYGEFPIRRASQLDPVVEYSTVSALVTIWTAAVLLLYLFVGDGEKHGFHTNFLAPYRGVLTALIIVVLMTFLANIFAYFGIQSRVQSLEAPVSLVNRTAKELASTSSALSDTASELGWDSNNLESPEQLVADDPAELSRLTSEIKEDASHVVQQTRETRDLADAAVTQVKSVSQIPATGGFQDRQVASLPSVAAVLLEAQRSAASLELDAMNLDKESDRLDDPESRDLSAMASIAGGIASSAKTTSFRAELASQALAGLESRGTSIVLWIAAFYSSFVLLPWVLLLMFLYRKRRLRAVEIVADLERLDPSRKLLQRALGTEEDLETLSPKAVDDLLERAFSNREYVLSVTLLMVLTAAGWYYFLYPRADIGISEWVSAEAGIRQMTTDLANDASPLTMGFAGAYFFVSQMLLRRYLSGDLYPSAYLQAAVRIIWVFTLSVALAVMLPRFGFQRADMAMIAFVAGIFPREGFRLITGTVSGVIARFLKWLLPGRAFPTDTDIAPLTELDGVNIWVESRLLEENVENVQGMATAPMEQLVVGTYYPASRIVDWVDQAILHTHCGHRQEWCPPLRRVGIRSATDLLVAAAPGSAFGQSDRESRLTPTSEGLMSIEKAVKESAAPNDAVASRLTAAVLCGMCEVIWPDPNLRYVFEYRDGADDDARVDTSVPDDSGTKAR